MSTELPVVAVVGLGYVGLPLALAFGRNNKTIGFDVSEGKIKSYQGGLDPTGEQPKTLFDEASHLSLTTNPAQLQVADFVIVTVPTPIDNANRPDLAFINQATKTVAENMQKGAIVVFESTVYPGVTEDVCVPLLEAHSDLKARIDFKVGYSPERVNPGDKVHTLKDIVKVVSGEDDETLEKVAKLYESIIDAGVYRAPSIQVAEAAKVIENTQRDLNIALINELSIVFNAMNIDTHEVLQAAASKWNFLPFKPGLVGGHCIGVDPYYLTHKAQELGYQPEVILAGRRINDGMGKYIAEQTVKQMIAAEHSVKGANVLVMGLTFKENCSDIRNTRVIDIVNELSTYGIQPVVWDPMASPQEAYSEYSIELAQWPSIKDYSAVIAAVAHAEILQIDLTELAGHAKKNAPFIDVKSVFQTQVLEHAGFNVWRL